MSHISELVCYTRTQNRSYTEQVVAMLLRECPVGYQQPCERPAGNSLSSRCKHTTDYISLFHNHMNRAQVVESSQ